MSLSSILLVVLVLLLVGALPSWPYSAGWGYWPSGGLGLVLLVVIVSGETITGSPRSGRCRSS